MDIKNGRLSHALAPGGPDIILPELFQHGGPHVFDQDRRLRYGDRQGRPEHKAQTACPVPVKGDIAPRGEPVQGQPEDPDKDNTQEKVREGNSQNVNEIQDMLSRGIAHPGRKDAQRYADQQNHDQGHDTQKGSHRDPVMHQGCHRHAVFDRSTEISLQESRDPVPVLDGQRQIGSQLFPQGLYRFLTGRSAQDQSGRISRTHVKSHKSHKGNQKYSQDQDQEFSDEIFHGHPPYTGTGRADLPRRNSSETETSPASAQLRPGPKTVPQSYWTLETDAKSIA